MKRADRLKPLYRQSLVAGFAGLMLLFSASASLAAVFSGTIISVSPSSGQIVVKSTTRGINRSFRVSKSARVSLDGKTAFLSRVRPGQTVSVFASGTNATRLIVRRPKSPSKSITDTPTRPRLSPEKTQRSAASDRTTPVRSPSPRTRPATPSASRSSTAAPDGFSNDWPQYRGPNRDNRSPARGLTTDWGSRGPETAWLATGLGEGYSSVALAHGMIYSMGNIGQDEMVLALDARTGNRVWATRSGNGFRQGAGNGPRGTPTVDGDHLYALGANGDLVCLEARNGRTVWQKNILREFGGRNIQWGISESVLVDGDRVICTPGGSSGTMVALNRLTGRTIWAARVQGNPQAAYSSPIICEVGGVRQYVNFVSSGVVGVRARDGSVMWGQQESANRTANCSSQIFYSNTIFSASGYGTGGALFRLQSRGGTTMSQSGWQTREMKNHHGGMVEIDGFLYGCDEQVLTCINLRTGDVAWKNRSVGKGSVTYADGHLYVRSEQGPVALVEVNPSRYLEKGRFEPAQKSGRRTWAHPVIAGGQMFLRDQDRLLACNIRQQ
ncbi:MAG: PQQ-binding-like beta-propeller repeat protein [Planctomycetaceae bacterium]